MKKVIFLLLLTAFIINLSGCVVAIGNSHKTPDSKAKPCKEEITNTTITEIDAAMLNLHSEEARFNILMAIANRPLSPKERTHLINAAMLNLHSESNREELLLKLAQTPMACPAPKPMPAPKPDCAAEEPQAKADK